MIKISHYFAWEICPTSKQSYEYINLSRLKDIEKKQMRYSDNYGIPFLSIIPSVTKVTKIDPTVAKHTPYEINERAYHFDVGVIIYEVTFSYTNNNPANFQELMNDTINGKSIISNMISQKCKYCGNPDACGHWSSTNVILLTTLIEVNSKGIFENFKRWIEKKINSQSREGELKAPIRTFYLDNYTLLNYVTYHLMLRNNSDNNNKSKNVKKSVQFALTLGYLVKHFRSKMINRALYNVPTLSANTDVKQQFFRTFFFFNFWANRDFITSKDEVNLEMRTLEKNSLVYIYENIFLEHFLKITDKDITNFSKASFLLLDELLSLIVKVPVGILTQYNSLFNAANYNLLSTRDLLDSFSELDQKIIQAMGHHLLKKMNSEIVAYDNVTEGAITISNLVKLLGLNRGSKNKTIKKSVDRLVTIGIIRHSTELKTKRTNATNFYYLNPYYPFTQTIIRYSRLSIKS